MQKTFYVNSISGYTRYYEGQGNLGFQFEHNLASGNHCSFHSYDWFFEVIDMIIAFNDIAGTGGPVDVEMVSKGRGKREKKKKKDYYYCWFKCGISAYLA